MTGSWDQGRRRITIYKNDPDNAIMDAMIGYTRYNPISPCHRSLAHFPEPTSDKGTKPETTIIVISSSSNSTSKLAAAGQ